MATKQSTFRIEMMGGLRVCLPCGKNVELPRRVTGTLLACLALNKKAGRSRDELIDFLWPDDDIEDGRRKLRQTLYSLRGYLGLQSTDDLFISTRDSIQLDASRVSTDVDEFEDAIRQAERQSDLGKRAELLSYADKLYAGELLAGFYHDDFQLERYRIAAMWRGALKKLVDALQMEGDTEGAIAVSARLVASDPLVEEAHADLMRLYASAGRPSEVSRQYRELERILREELSSEPAEAIRLLAESLRMETGLSSVPSSEKAPAADDGNSHLLPTSDPTAGFRLLRRATIIAVTSLAALCLAGFWYVSHRRMINVTRPAKLPATGQLLARATYSGMPGDRDSEPVAIHVDSHGYITVAGFAQTLKHDIDMVIARFDPRAIQIWDYRFNGEGDDMDRAVAMAVDDRGFTYLTGESMGQSGSGHENLSELDIVTLKLSPDGRLIWKRIYNGAANGKDSPCALKIDSRGDVYVAGRSWSGSKIGYRAILLKYSSSGEPLWSHIEGTSGSNTNGSDLVVSQNGVFLAGFEKPAVRASANRCFLVSLSPDGKTRWRKDFRGYRDMREGSVLVAADVSGVYIAWQAADSGKTTGRPIAVSKLTAGGSLQGECLLESASGAVEVPSDLRTRPGGGAVLAGMRQGQDKGLLIASIDSSGSIQWQKALPAETRYILPGPRVAVGSAGYVAISGSDYHNPTSTSGGRSDVVTHYFNPDGSHLWSARFEGTGGWNSTAAVAGLAGESYVAVRSTQSGIPQIQILKYSAFPAPASP